MVEDNDHDMCVIMCVVGSVRQSMHTVLRLREDGARCMGPQRARVDVVVGRCGVRVRHLEVAVVAQIVAVRVHVVVVVRVPR